jgi:nucleotide-binding universal stress UspA family protein
MYRHILIPTDGSPLSEKAVTHGVALAARLAAHVSFLTVTEPFHAFSFAIDQVEDTPNTYWKHMKERATRILCEAHKVAEAAGVAHDVAHVVDDQPCRAIIRFAEEKNCDLIAMASHGRRGATALVLGSETTRVLTHSTVPVLVYRSSMGNADRVRRYEGKVDLVGRQPLI